AANPVFADRREQIGGERIFERLDQVGRVGRNGGDLAASDDAFLAGDHEAELATLNHTYLLVYVAMQRNDSARTQPEARHGHGLSVNHLARNHGVQLLFRNFGPVVKVHNDPVFYHEDHERDRTGRWQRQQAVSAHQNHEQAPAADLRSAHDL